jgi:hypothetical protein
VLDGLVATRLLEHRLYRFVQRMCLGNVVEKPHVRRRHPARLPRDDVARAHVAAHRLRCSVAQDGLGARELGLAPRAAVPLVDVRPVAVKVPQPRLGVASGEHLWTAMNWAGPRALLCSALVVLVRRLLCVRPPVRAWAVFVWSARRWRGSGEEDKLLRECLALAGRRAATSGYGGAAWLLFMRRRLRVRGRRRQGSL